MRVSYKCVHVLTISQTLCQGLYVHEVTLSSGASVECVFYLPRAAWP